MCNVSKLKSKIVENGMTVSKFADAALIGRDTLYRRLRSGGNHFTLEEIQKITKILSLTSEEVMLIFFTDTK